VKKVKNKIKNSEIKLPKKLIKGVDNNVEAQKTISRALDIIKDVKVKYDF